MSISWLVYRCTCLIVYFVLLYVCTCFILYLCTYVIVIFQHVDLWSYQVLILYHTSCFIIFISDNIMFSYFSYFILNNISIYCNIFLSGYIWFSYIFILFIVSVLERDEGYTVKYSTLSTWPPVSVKVWTKRELLHCRVPPPCYQHLSKQACPWIQIAATMKPNSSG